MKLEYLATGSPDCPLIRLFSFDSSEAQKLRNLVAMLSTRSSPQLDLNEHLSIQAVGGCSLSLRTGNQDEGIRRCGPTSFECVLTTNGWEQVEGLLAPFCESATGYQWLIDTGTIRLLISVTGKW